MLLTTTLMPTICTFTGSSSGPSTSLPTHALCSVRAALRALALSWRQSTSSPASTQAAAQQLLLQQALSLLELPLGPLLVRLPALLPGLLLVLLVPLPGLQLAPPPGPLVLWLPRVLLPVPSSPWQGQGMAAATALQQPRARAGRAQQPGHRAWAGFATWPAWSAAYDACVAHSVSFTVRTLCA